MVCCKESHFFLLQNLLTLLRGQPYKHTHAQFRSAYAYSTLRVPRNRGISSMSKKIRLGLSPAFIYTSVIDNDNILSHQYALGIPRGLLMSAKALYRRRVLCRTIDTITWEITARCSCYSVMLVREWPS